MSDKDSPFHYFGIRHHGPGSARSLRRALQALKPDLVLIEGPEEAESILHFADHPAMKPPVALLLYGSVEGESAPRATFFPFAEFSPEWQAIRLALQERVPVRFIDLPQSQNLADNWQPPVPAAGETSPDEEAPAAVDGEAGTADNDTSATPAQPDPWRNRDPIGLLAEAAGYHDSERFWEHLVEQQAHADGVFDAIHEAMAGVRAALPKPEGPRARREACREAWMRQNLRAAEKDGFKRIAVVVGAWHVPALQELKKTRKDDAALLKPLAKIKVQAAWIPWTHGRLLSSQGYGAGIESPGWYQHLWEHYQQDEADGEAITIGWLAKFAQALRAEGLDASSAQLVDAGRLIATLAAMRGRRLPDLDDLQEAIVSVLHHGDTLPLTLSRKLLVGDVLGEIPDDTPSLPLQTDFQKQCKSLRLKQEADSRDLTLDLREEQGLAKSRFLHRLRLLGIPWGEVTAAGGRGTFKEGWRLLWTPELSLKLLEAAIWGQTVNEAAVSFLQHRISEEQDIPAIATLIEQALVADLAPALPALIERIMALSTHTDDVSHLIQALEPLANAWRYGSVRQTNTEALAAVVSSFVLRICIGLPAAVSSLNDEAAQVWQGQLKALDRVLLRLDDDDLLQEWRKLVLRLVDQAGLHGLPAGWCCRVACIHDWLDAEAAAGHFSRALSSANEIGRTAAWFEGFLAGQGLSLLHDDALWRLVDDWLAGLGEEHFVQVLPLLRRTTATFSKPERIQLAARQQGQASGAAAAKAVDEMRAARVLPVLAQIFGVALPQPLTAPMDSTGGTP
ncbi:MAG: DUF5682 family protein [Fluviicoccus sp.]|uniref:DUF5682 family protein n=1 Tax=Fluviicoccus sp. TaxID=2003552 RepID=UPI00271A0F57|nr:DUF5682 family protein [Fluviicoccus sp.]MDO8329629.1 DUF5682 family protein [Fluviicoccus sp.]